MSLSPYFLIVTVLLPVFAGILVYVCRSMGSKKRKIIIFSSVLLNSISVWLLIVFCSKECALIFNLADNLSIRFCFDGFGRFFAGIVATLWPVTTLFS